MGTNPCSYELIFHPHIEEDQTKLVCFIKNKSIWSRFFFRNLRFKIFFVTMELHCNGKNLKSKISFKKFFIKLIFSCLSSSRSLDVRRSVGPSVRLSVMFVKKWSLEYQMRVSEWWIDWLTDWVSDWVTELLSDWVTEWLSDWVTEWLND